MKYVSLIGLMTMYGYAVKDRHCHYNFDYNLTNVGFDRKDDFRPFVIEKDTNEKNHIKDANPNQVMHKLTEKNSITHYSFISGNFVVPPILEVEWLANELGLSEEETEVMNQMGYSFMIWIMSWIYDGEVDRWLHYMENEKAIIEVEDLKDTPYILAADPMPNVTPPKAKTWADIIVYGEDFPSIYRRCVSQTVSFKELYQHMPILLAIFMRDYCSNELNDWPKPLRLSVENEIQDYFVQLDSYTTKIGLIYTYSLSTGITNKDVELMRNVLIIIYNKIHTLNSKIGLISYTQYGNIRGPEKIQASIRLTGMNIKWQEEIDRANDEKKAHEEDNEESDDDELFDEF